MQIMTMERKEFLVIFLLAVLVTWDSGFVSHSSPGCGNFPDALCAGGWPLIFHQVGGIWGINQWLWFNLLLDLLFWLLVLAGGWYVVKELKTKK